MNVLKHIWLFIGKHKYLITIAAFLLIICVLDENNLMRRAEHIREIRELKSEIKLYREKYEHDNAILQELNGDDNELEKIAREKYFMKRENEDIYIFQKDLEKSEN